MPSTAPASHGELNKRVVTVIIINTVVINEFQCHEENAV